MSQVTGTLKYYEDEGFTFLIQQFDERLVLHCEVHKWKPSVLKRLYEVFNTLRSEARNLGIMSLIAITKNTKFTSMFNGVEIQTLSVKGEEFKVVEWDLK